MVECRYRIPVETTKKDGINEAFNRALPSQFFAAGVVGSLKQTFCNGLCQILTRNDIGPLECQQPEHSSRTCPDIDHLRRHQEAKRS